MGLLATTTGAGGSIYNFRTRILPGSLRIKPGDMSEPAEFKSCVFTEKKRTVIITEDTLHLGMEA